MTTFIRLLRVKQWVKNAFILFPVIFSGQLYHGQLLANTLWTFGAFCLISSSIYILNDLLDVQADRQHPVKSKRPLAQGLIPLWAGGVIMFLLLLIGLGIAKAVNEAILSMALFYVFMHMVYNFYAKKVVILDVIFIAIGFQLRIWAGSLACDVLPSVWLQFCVLLLSLFLGFIKRRHELMLLKDHAAEHRSVLGEYTAYLLDQLIMVCATLTIVFYGLYTISPEIQMRLGHQMLYSMFFVIYGMFRFLYLVHVRKLGGDPGEVITRDFPSILNLLLWVTFLVMVLYAK